MGLRFEVVHSYPAVRVVDDDTDNTVYEIIAEGLDCLSIRGINAIRIPRTKRKIVDPTSMQVHPEATNSIRITGTVREL